MGPGPATRHHTFDFAEGFHLEWYRRVVWGKPAPYSASPAPAALTATVDTADPVAGASAGTYTLKLVHAPGHCPDHHVVYVPETGWLFAADLFVTARPSMARFDEDVLAGIRTLESILQDPTMELSTLFCAHRGPIDDATTALTSLLEHLLSVRARLLRGWADDPDLRAGVQGLTTSVLGREGPLRFISQGDFSKLHLARGLLGGYDRAAATRASIGSLSPSEAVAYLEGSGLAGPGAISALDIANPKWLAEHRLYIQDGVSLGQTPRIPGTGLDHRGRGQPGGIPGPKPGIAAVGVSPAAAHAAAARGALSAALPSQPPPARLTMRDAQQSHKSAVDQSPIFHHAKAEPRRGASLVSQQGRVLMPDGSMDTAEAAASAMAEASVSRQEFRFAERARALHGSSPIGSAYAKQVRASLPSEESAPLLEKGGHRKDST